jgi:hypothetical protein
MPKSCPLLQRFLTLFIASILFGCSTTAPHPKFDVAALKPYQKLMLVQVKTEEMLFVTTRVRDIPIATRAGLEDLYGSWVLQMNQVFNKQIKRDMKPELEAKLYAEIIKNFTANQIKYTTFEVSGRDILLNRYTDKKKADYLLLLRQKCPACDAALLIDPSFGFVQKNSAGWRAVSNADLLLLNLVDGTVRTKSLISFVDEISKYDFPTDTDLLKDAPSAAQYIQPTVLGLAKVMLGSTGL